MSQPGRNEPWPCGSGRKYKHCHGAVAMKLDAPTARECGPCTACCEGWAEGEIRGHRMQPGQPCHFLAPASERSTGSSPCRIYDERPESPCRRFVCGWLAAGSPFPEAFRPDRAGVILVATRWQARRAWILLPAGRDAPPEMLAWMQGYAQTTGEPFYYTQQGERLGYGPPQFQQEMLQKVQRGEKLW